MLEKIYKKYFQKSKSFLYPALGIRKKSHVTPINTYIAIENKIGIEDVKLICVFDKEEIEKNKLFEENMLLSNPLFLEKVELKDECLYIFSLEIYETDYFNFVLGKYSKFSSVLKKAIRDYFGEKSQEYSYIETYLHPDKFYERYSELLDIDLETLKNIGELCNPPDVDKETLKLSEENFELIKEKNITS